MEVILSIGLDLSGSSCFNKMKLRFSKLNDLLSFSDPETIRIDLYLELAIKFVVPRMHIFRIYCLKLPPVVSRVMNLRPVVRT